MLATTATVLSALIGAAVIAMGVFNSLRPQAATGFGIPATPTEDKAFRAWLTVKGNRDVGTGLLLLIAAIGAPLHLLGWMVLAACVMPLGDMATVLRSGGAKGTAYGVHGATAAVMALVGVLGVVG